MTDLNLIQSTVDKSHKILICTVDKPSFDGVAASLGLYLILKQAGKEVIVASNSQPLVRDSHLVGLDKIKTNIGQANLVISFPYKEEQVNKVVSDIQDDIFNLIIEPKPGNPPVKIEDLKFSYRGAQADLIIIIGARQLDDVGPILLEEKDLLDKTPILNLSNQPSSFGKFNLVDPQASLSEIVTALSQELGLKLNQDAAQNLLLGIEDATNHLQANNLTADTFEALATLYRAGARRPKPTQPTPAQKESIDNFTQSLKAKPESQSKSKPKLQYVPLPSEKKLETSTITPQPDWLKPKIFKSSSVPQDLNK